MSAGFHVGLTHPRDPHVGISFISLITSYLLFLHHCVGDYDLSQVYLQFRNLSSVTPQNQRSNPSAFRLRSLVGCAKGPGLVGGDGPFPSFPICSRTLSLVFASYIVLAPLRGSPSFPISVIRPSCMLNM
ncbi:hypothetical protein BDV33DRAFT_181780 [Aspergillus novoparasiticus]|uniref:Uncharacterized protein n=1 Tax=Aspergillus novoparasiticus TaxID=986946 RepID=A0A5N6EDN3_9EURO|nr:hypothetical protein BDV33DRAFT_181780 [Aspergillus novoparasiticus]